MHFTDEQINIADGVPIMEILRMQNEEYKRVGSCYYWKAHDSLHFTGSKWFRFSTHEGGRAIRFCERFLNMSFQEATEYLLRNFAPNVLEWSRENINNASGGTSGTENKGFGGFKREAAFLEETDEVKVEKKEFESPIPAETNKHVYAYLTKERGIDPAIVSFFMERRDIYEERKHSWAVFAGRDKNKWMRCASIHGVTMNDNHSKWTAKGSDLRYGFGFKGSGEKVYVFEAPIDLLSFITMYQKDWQNNSYISLSGVSGNALKQILRDCPNLSKVYMCLDNDEAGEQGCKRIYKELKTTGKEFQRIKPVHKDWNEDLLAEGMGGQTTQWGISQV